MRILLNGEDHTLIGVSDVAALIASLGLDGRKVAVERNLEIVAKSTYAATPVMDGDRIEIVAFIGGG
jgi:sulfur carrier protein